MKPDARDNWDLHWKEAAEAASENPAQRYRHELILRQLARTDATGSTMKLLDFGSGQGDFLEKAKNRFPLATLTGLELSQEGIDITLRKVPTAQILKVNLLQKQESGFPFRLWATHGVCSEVLEHLDDPAIFVKAMSECLRPNAHLIVTVPSGPMSAFDKKIGHRKHFSPVDLSLLLEENGFTVRRLCRAGFPFHNLYRLAVIARGKRLTTDAQEIGRGRGLLVQMVMRPFGVLFKANMLDSPWGWQLIALAEKKYKANHAEYTRGKSA